MPAKFSIRRGILSNVIGETTDFAEAGFGDVAAALWFLGQADTATNPSLDCNFSSGIWTPSADLHVAVHDKGGSNPRVTSRMVGPDYCAVLLPSSGALTRFVSYRGSAITDGVRLQCIESSTGVQRPAMGLLIGGGVPVATGILAPQESVGAVRTVSGLPFRPSVIFFMDNGLSIPGQATTFIHSCGFAWDAPGGVVNRGLFSRSTDAAGASQTTVQIDDRYHSAQMSPSGPGWALETIAFLDDGFQVRTQVGAPSGDRIYYLAWPLDGATFWMDLIDTPGTPGLQSYIEPNIRPHAIFLASSGCTAQNTATDGLRVGFGGAQVDEEMHLSFRAGHGSSGASSQSQDDQQALMILDPITAAPEETASLESFDPQGFTLNYSASATARKVLALAIGTPTTGQLIVPGRTVDGEIDVENPRADDWINEDLVYWQLAGLAQPSGVGNPVYPLYAPRATDCLGALTNQANFDGPAGRPGGWGTLTFGAAGGYLNLGDNCLGPLVDGAEGITFGCWVYLRSTRTDQYDNVIVSGQINSGNSGLWLNIRGDSSLANQVLAGGRSYSGDDFQFRYTQEASPPVPINVWRHVAARFHYATNMIEIFVDGRWISSTTGGVVFGRPTWEQGTTTVDDYISGITASRAWDGWLDDFRLFRRALEPEEISDWAMESADRCSRSLARKPSPTTYWITPAPEVPVEGQIVVPQRTNVNDVFPTGLVARWNGDPASAQTAPELAGINSIANGQLLDDASLRPNQILGGEAFRFVESDARVEVADHPSLRLTGELSISVWAARAAFQSVSQNEGIVAKYGEAGNNRAYALFVEQASGYLGAVISDDGTYKAAGELVSNVSVRDDTWHHIGFSFRPSQFMRLYLDGQLIAEKTSGVLTQIHGGTAPLWIGKQFNLASQTTLIGRVDEALLFDRVLDASEFEYLRLLGKPDQDELEQPTVFTVTPDVTPAEYQIVRPQFEQPLPGSLQFCYNGDAGGGSVAADRGLLNKNGTLLNGASRAPNKLLGGQGFLLDGTDDRVDRPAYQLPGDELTVSAWIYVTKDPIGSWRGVILSNFAGAFGMSFAVAQWSAGFSKLQSWWHGIAISLSTANPVPSDEWTHVAFTLRGSEHVQYVNGRRLQSYSITPPNLTGGVWSIGREGVSANPDNHFGGIVDEVQLYAQFCDDSEIMDLYLLGKPDFESQPTVFTVTAEPEPPAVTIVPSPPIEEEDLLPRKLLARWNGDVTDHNNTYERARILPNADGFNADGPDRVPNDLLGGEAWRFQQSNNDYWSMRHFPVFTGNAGTPSYSIACWVKPSANNQFGWIAQQWDEAPQSGPALFQLNSNNAVVWQVGTGNERINVNNVLFAGQWTFLVASRFPDLGGGSEVCLHVNGSYFPVFGPSAIDSTDLSVIFRIGGEAGRGGIAAFDGLIDEVQIYSPALNSAESRDLFYTGKPYHQNRPTAFFLGAPPVGPVEATLSEPASAGDAMSAILATEQQLVESTDAGDTWVGAKQTEVSVTEAATAGDTWAAGLMVVASLTEGASAGDASARTAQFPVIITDPATAGRAYQADITFGVQLVEAATSLGFFVALEENEVIWGGLADTSDQWDGFLVSPQTIDEAAQAGDAWAVTLYASLTEGAVAGDEYMEDTFQLASLTEAAEAGDAWVSPGVAAFETLTEPAEAGDLWAVTVQTEASLTEGALTLDAWTPAGIVPAVMTEGATASDAWSAEGFYPATLSEGATAGDAWSYEAFLVGVLTEAATAGDTWAYEALLAGLLIEGATAGDLYQTQGTMVAFVIEGVQALDWWQRYHPPPAGGWVPAHVRVEEALRWGLAASDSARWGLTTSEEGDPMG